MSKCHNTEPQMIRALKQPEAGRKDEGVAREVGVSKHTIYAWKAKSSASVSGTPCSVFGTIRGSLRGGLEPPRPTRGNRVTAGPFRPGSRTCANLAEGRRIERPSLITIPAKAFVGIPLSLLWPLSSALICVRALFYKNNV
jgi:hypothetical protein